MTKLSNLSPPSSQIYLHNDSKVYTIGSCQNIKDNYIYALFHMSGYSFEGQQYVDK